MSDMPLTPLKECWGNNQNTIKRMQIVIPKLLQIDFVIWVRN